FASSRSTRTTRARAAARRRQVARPMPLAAPVTIATRSANPVTTASAPSRPVVRLLRLRRGALLLLPRLAPHPLRDPLVVLARQDDRHLQADALRGQHLAPFADQRAVRLADRPDLPV